MMMMMSPCCCRNRSCSVLLLFLWLIMVETSGVCHGWTTILLPTTKKATPLFRHNRRQQPPHQRQQSSSLSSSSSLSLSRHQYDDDETTNTAAAASQQKPYQANFEYQELLILLDAMKRNQVTSRTLPLDRKQEVESYMERIVQYRPSLVSFQDIVKVLPGTCWRLAYSNDKTVLGDLPRDATVLLEFETDQNMNYVLQFIPSSQPQMGLKRIVAKSLYNVQDGPNDAGWVTFVYQDITADVFGFTNLGVGFFGLLKGRTNGIQTAYFDGTLWLERRTIPNTGEVYYNTYVREKDTQGIVGS